MKQEPITRGNGLLYERNPKKEGIQKEGRNQRKEGIQKEGRNQRKEGIQKKVLQIMTFSKFDAHAQQSFIYST